ncbi:regulator of chromosome condensation isoform X1 [Pieris napi]|uniref:regulator of chromosome condensation isoform X1 n=1 Tax=Pieris napi TaxID=78633 RepID=UPI001FB9D173|nr:regulator of chromosome condensation isoform X1 [Pieris napi]
MPAARGVKRTASKTSAVTASSAPKNKKKRGAIQLEVPSAPKGRGCVLTCGQGDVGQLGLGEDVIETTKFKQVTRLGNKIVDACAGGMHTVALDFEGKVWTFGCNDEGALGRPTTNEQEEGTPSSVSLPAPAVSVSAGDSHSAALLNNGDVYAWGAFRDSHGTMGLVLRAREGKPSKEPLKLAIPETAVGIASGGDHLVVLSTSGAVYTMGCGEQGQLGRLSQRSASREARHGFSALLVPSKVTLKCVVSRVWAGYHATFALDAVSDKMFAWGLNNYGQLGITGDKRKIALHTPTECDAFSNTLSWQEVALGQHHSLALDSNGQVYAVGRCEYGRLGLGDRNKDAEALEPLPALQNKKCISIAAGTSNSFALTETGEVLGWGMGSEGQLGTGTSSDANEPTPSICLGVNLSAGSHKPARISAGGQHTVLFVEDTSPQKEPSPKPEPEEPQAEVESEPKAKKAKQEQDQQVTSTSASEVSVEVKGKRKRKESTSSEKINGDEKKETAMEVDDTDKSEKSQEENKQTDTDQSADETSQDSKVETMDTSSQDTLDSETDKHTEKDEADDKQTDDKVEKIESEMDTDSEKVPEKTEKPEKVEKISEKSEKLETEVNGVEGPVA